MIQGEDLIESLKKKNKPKTSALKSYCGNDLYVSVLKGQRD